MLKHNDSLTLNLLKISIILPLEVVEVHIHHSLEVVRKFQEEDHTEVLQIAEEPLLADLVRLHWKLELLFHCLYIQKYLTKTSNTIRQIYLE